MEIYNSVQKNYKVGMPWLPPSLGLSNLPQLTSMFELIMRYQQDLNVFSCISMQPEFELLQGISNMGIHTSHDQMIIYVRVRPRENKF